MVWQSSTCRNTGLYKKTCKVPIMNCKPSESAFCVEYEKTVMKGYIPSDELKLKLAERTLVVVFDYKQENSEKWNAMKQTVFKGFPGGGALVDLAIVIPTNAGSNAYPSPGGVSEQGSIFDWAKYSWEARDELSRHDTNLGQLSIDELQARTGLDRAFWDTSFDFIVKSDPEKRSHNWRDLRKSNLGGTSMNWERNGDSVERSTQANILFQRWFIGEKIVELALREKYSKFIVVNADYYFGCPCQTDFTTPYKYSDVTTVEHHSWIPQTSKMDFMVCPSFWISQCLAAPHISHPGDFVDLEGGQYDFLEAQGQQIMQELTVERMCPQGKELLPIKTQGASNLYPGWPVCKSEYLRKNGQFKTTHRTGYLTGLKGFGSDTRPDFDFPGSEMPASILNRDRNR